MTKKMLITGYQWGYRPQTGPIGWGATGYQRLSRRLAGAVHGPVLLLTGHQQVTGVADNLV